MLRVYALHYQANRNRYLNITGTVLVSLNEDLGTDVEEYRVWQDAILVLSVIITDCFKAPDLLFVCGALDGFRPVV